MSTENLKNKSFRANELSKCPFTEQELQLNFPLVKVKQIEILAKQS